jgi:AbrB family looped-hinge helix DNA binding protein
MSNHAVLSSKGQITIPAEVRAALHLNQGDCVSFEVVGREAILRPAASGSSFAAYAGRLSKGTGRGARDIVEELRKARGW